VIYDSLFTIGTIGQNTSVPVQEKRVLLEIAREDIVIPAVHDFYLQLCPALSHPKFFSIFLQTSFYMKPLQKPRWRLSHA
jgi:hypothetical protein